MDGPACAGACARKPLAHITTARDGALKPRDVVAGLDPAPTTTSSPFEICVNSCARCVGSAPRASPAADSRERVARNADPRLSNVKSAAAAFCRSAATLQS